MTRRLKERENHRQSPLLVVVDLKILRGKVMSDLLKEVLVLRLIMKRK